MKALFTAIYNKFVADGKYGLSALYNTQAKDDAVFPYATMTLVSNTPGWTFTENYEDCLIQFNLFDDDPVATDISDSAEALINAFDFFNLVVTGFTTIKLEREVARLFRAENVWQYTITYRILMQKN